MRTYYVFQLALLVLSCTRAVGDRKRFCESSNSDCDDAYNEEEGRNDTRSSRDDYPQQYRAYNSDKEHPNKGDPSCNSLGERIEYMRQGNMMEALLPCRESDSQDEDDDTSFNDIFQDEDDDELAEPTPTVMTAPNTTTTPNNMTTTGRQAQNSIRFNLYLALQPQTRSLGTMLKKFVTCYLHRHSLDYTFRIKASDKNPNLPGTLPVLISHFCEFPKTNAKAEMVLVLTRPRIIQKDTNMTWWKYKFKYDCFWPDSTNPILNATALRRIKRSTRKLLYEAMRMKEEQEELLENLGYDTKSFVEIQLEPPPLPPMEENGKIQPRPPHPPPHAPPPQHGGAPQHVPPEIPQEDTIDRGFPEIQDFMEPVDPTEWDWRRYVGLGLLVTTVMGTLCLVQLAGLRRRKRKRKELWGNLATEEGVNELLRVGWKVRGTKMEVYDKKNLGYDDDNSMLIGGFEQSELVGGEITLTHDETGTTTTPDVSYR